MCFWSTDGDSHHHDLCGRQWSAGAFLHLLGVAVPRYSDARPHRPQGQEQRQSSTLQGQTLRIMSLLNSDVFLATSKIVSFGVCVSKEHSDFKVRAKCVCVTGLVSTYL